MHAVRLQLESLGAPALFADQTAILQTAIELVVGETVSASLCLPCGAFDLTSVTAAYLRPYCSCDLPQIASAGSESPEWKHAAQVDDIISSWAEISPAFLINPLHAMAVNNSKPYQMEQIRRQGWSVPETLITTDPDAARVFWETHDSVIYKSVSGIRSRVSRVGPGHYQRLGDIASCPTQFQAFIPGRDYRAHVVGDEVFACEILCDADDYRYPCEDDVDIRACVLPREVEDRCRVTAKSANLPFTGIDLRRTATGEWFCFELNPSPGFTYYEHRAGQPIAQAVARLLTEQARRPEAVAN